MSKQRLDVLLVQQGRARTRSEAQRLIRAGWVRLGDRVVDKPGMRLPNSSTLFVTSRPRFVSRGGDKLEAAISRFKIDVASNVAADVGASTGGFTDCLLQHGATRVYAIDVGYGQLEYRLRNDDRVVVMERTNARYLQALPEAVDVVTADVSFISLGLILATAVGWLKSNGQVVALIKPQFEAGRREVGKGGVVRSPEVHRQVILKVLRVSEELGLGLCGLTVSPLRGPAGNVEFLGWWHRGPDVVDGSGEVAQALADAGRMVGR